MSERKSKNLFLIGYVSLMILLMIMSSCGTSHLTQKQVKINYELDKLWIDYKYESDSLINEFYKKQYDETRKSNNNNKWIYGIRYWSYSNVNDKLS